MVTEVRKKRHKMGYKTRDRWWVNRSGSRDMAKQEMLGTLAPRCMCKEGTKFLEAFQAY